MMVDLQSRWMELIGGHEVVLLDMSIRTALKSHGVLGCAGQENSSQSSPISSLVLCVLLEGKVKSVDHHSVAQRQSQ